MIKNYEDSTHINSIRKREKDFIIKEIQFNKGLNKLSFFSLLISIPYPIFFSLTHFCIDFRSCASPDKYSVPVLFFVFLLILIFIYYFLKRLKTIKELKINMKNLNYCESIVKKPTILY